jgi:peptidoglycan hydrolase-like protein with peptidoglycan-binding domain
VPKRVPVSHAVALVAACLTVLLLAGPVATSSARELGSRPLAEGTRGKDVRELQKLLRKAGFSPKVDGVYGHRTWRIVRRLERELGVRVDGVATAADIRRLRLALKPSTGTGGTTFSDERARPRAVSAQEVPGAKAQLTDDGLAIAPADAPQEVKDIIAAGNEIAKLPYRYGGGHGKWKDTAYDCSGSVSFALHGADLLEAPMPSGSFESWGDAGPGEWVTLYANGGHIFMYVAGLRFDTSGRSQTGSRWQTAKRSASGYTVRHPEGL